MPLPPYEGDDPEQTRRWNEYKSLEPPPIVTEKLANVRAIKEHAKAIGISKTPELDGQIKALEAEIANYASAKQAALGNFMIERDYAPVNPHPRVAAGGAAPRSRGVPAAALEESPAVHATTLPRLAQIPAMVDVRKRYLASSKAGNELYNATNNTIFVRNKWTDLGSLADSDWQEWCEKNKLPLQWRASAAFTNLS